MWHRYLKESQDIDSVITDRGFITFQFFKDVCIIHDFYVLPEYRGTKEAIILAEMVKSMAAEKGCSSIGAEVYLARPGFDQNMKLFQHWKMKEADRNEHRVVLARELGEGDYDGQKADYRRS